MMCRTMTVSTYRTSKCNQPWIMTASRDSSPRRHGSQRQAPQLQRAARADPPLRHRSGLDAMPMVRSGRVVPGTQPASGIPPALEPASMRLPPAGPASTRAFRCAAGAAALIMVSAWRMCCMCCVRGACARVPTAVSAALGSQTRVQSDTGAVCTCLAPAALGSQTRPAQVRESVRAAAIAMPARSDTGGRDAKHRRGRWGGARCGPRHCCGRCAPVPAERCGAACRLAGCAASRLNRTLNRSSLPAGPNLIGPSASWLGQMPHPQVGDGSRVTARVGLISFYLFLSLFISFYLFLSPGFLCCAAVLVPCVD